MDQNDCKLSQFKTAECFLQIPWHSDYCQTAKGQCHSASIQKIIFSDFWLASLIWVFSLCLSKQCQIVVNRVNELKLEGHSNLLCLVDQRLLYFLEAVWAVSLSLLRVPKGNFRNKACFASTSVNTVKILPNFESPLKTQKFQKWSLTKFACPQSYLFAIQIFRAWQKSEYWKILRTISEITLVDVFCKRRVLQVSADMQ